MVIVIDLQFNSMWDGSAAVGVRRGGQNAEQALQWQGACKTLTESSVRAGSWSLLDYAPGALSDM